ncbi:hypothetical protein CEXT_558211 [Caerostris extrusa]|uniref:Uncharacterized protein n=1 Tax=Caerostris extrusa TaxID=172846 RepID=A0AAV4WCA3_CAEEX|nr:hypothetical protein CEXT_558211 [Caerostris extrusa]
MAESIPHGRHRGSRLWGGAAPHWGKKLFFCFFPRPPPLFFSKACQVTGRRTSKSRLFHVESDSSGIYEQLVQKQEKISLLGSSGWCANDWK